MKDEYHRRSAWLRSGSIATLVRMQKRTTLALSILLLLGLLLWGGITYLLYIGVPVHSVVLLPDAAQTRVNDLCGGDLLCRGGYSFLPFITFAFTRGKVFLPYVILWALLWGGFVGWQILRTGNHRIRITLAPWRLFLLFLLCLWTMFTVLSFARKEDFPVRRLFEAVPQVYENIGEDSLASLQENFQRLLRRGCLRPVGQTVSGAGVYDLKTWCIQTAFVTRVLTQVVFIVLFLFELLVLGRALLLFLGIRPRSLLLESLLSTALGACALVAILWCLAVFGILTAPVGWLLACLIPIAGIRHSRVWLQRGFTESWTVERPWWSATVLLTWLLLSYLALNFLSVLRPFPIGWDDLGSYLNRPRLMVSYGHFIFSMAQFQWEYITALGFLLFGYNSPFGATASLLINWTAGLLAVWVVYTFSRTFLGKGSGVLAALLYYSLPLVGHFSYADMKVDNAVFTMSSLALFTLFLSLFPPTENTEEAQEKHMLPQRWLILAGLFGGFAFAMKPTVVMVLMSSGAILLGAGLHWSAFVGASFLGLAVFAFKGILNIRVISERAFGEVLISPKMFAAFCVLLGLALLVWGYLRDRQRFRELLRSVAVFVGCFLLAVIPWVVHNNIELGNYGIPRIETGAPNTISPTIAIGGLKDVRDFGQEIRTLPPELALNMQHPECQPTGNIEELDRYWGYGKGLRHYLTLPWRTIMNLDSGGYYVTTMPALFLLPLILLLPAFWHPRQRWFRWLFLGTFFVLIEWMLLANGIPWYGLGMFLGITVCLEAFTRFMPDTVTRVIVGVLIAASLLLNFSNRFWQFDLQRNMLEYPFGKITADALEERTIPYYDDISRAAVELHQTDPERPYLYRVGTFIPYFIPRNLEIIGITDHQLDTFNCLHQERDPALTLRRLKTLGFSSIIFDTNTATIERDVNGSLHRKVRLFVDFLNTSSIGLQVVINDPDSGVVYVLIP